MALKTPISALQVSAVVFVTLILHWHEDGFIMRNYETVRGILTVSIQLQSFSLFHENSKIALATISNVVVTQVDI